MARGTSKDLFHGTGNQTVGLPKNIKSGKKIIADPHTSPGKLLPTTKKVQDGWNK
jgi:hypothetical protein